MTAIYLLASKLVKWVTGYIQLVKLRWDRAKWTTIKQFVEKQEHNITTYPFLAWMDLVGDEILEKQGYCAAVEAAQAWLKRAADYPLCEIVNYNEFTDSLIQRRDEWDEKHPSVSYRDLKKGDPVFHYDEMTETYIPCKYEGSGFAATKSGSLVREKSYLRREPDEEAIGLYDILNDEKVALITNPGGSSLTINFAGLEKP